MCLCMCAYQTICNNPAIGFLVYVFYLHFVYLCAFMEVILTTLARELSAFSTKKDEKR